MLENYEIYKVTYQKVPCRNVELKIEIVIQIGYTLWPN